MAYQSLILERDDNVAVVTLNRPGKLNAIDQHLHLEMMQVCQELSRDDDIRAVVWTGAGRGFSSGADLTSPDRKVGELGSRQGRLDEFGWVGRQAMAVSRDLGKPTIAAVNGVAAGAGMSLALACDLRVGTVNSRFKTVFIERSLSPDSGMSYFLPRIVGMSRACDLLYTSRMVDSEEAHRIGLLDRMSEPENLLGDALALAREIAFWPPVAMEMTRRVLQHSLESTLEEQLKYERHGLIFAQRAPHDVSEARDSFRERRPPNFTGE
jgi:2-(1,2-epoxy-1,2-dihydrophenyl)acetyl-CoA isomerase